MIDFIWKKIKALITEPANGSAPFSSSDVDVYSEVIQGTDNKNYIFRFYRKSREEGKPDQLIAVLTQAEEESAKDFRKRVADFEAAQ